MIKMDDRIYEDRQTTEEKKLRTAHQAILSPAVGPEFAS